MAVKYHGLTENQEKFVIGLIAGKTQRQAYLDAFPKSQKWKVESVDRQASVLFKQQKIKDRYDELFKPYLEKHDKEVEKEMSKVFLSLDRKHELLYEFAENELLSPAIRMQAIDLDNKMINLYTQKQEITTGRNTKFDDIISQLSGKEDNGK